MIENDLDRQQRAERFADAARTGKTDELFDEALRELIEQIGRGQTLEQEIGALRLVLMQVISVDLLEGDPAKTSATITKLANAIVRAVRTQREVNDASADNLGALINRTLSEMGIGEES